MHPGLTNKSKTTFCIFTCILFLLSACNNEFKTYKRVGGNHLHLTWGDKQLFWFNGIHSTNPENPMFADLHDAFMEFEPDLVLTEGHAHQHVPSDSLTAIQSGEPVFTAYLAHEKLIPCMDTEAKDEDINNFLLSKYDKESIAAMYIIRQMVQWDREGVEEEFESLLKDFAISIGEDLEIENLDELADISKLLEPYTGIELLLNSNWKEYNAKQYIYFSENHVNEIYEEAIAFRNNYLLHLLEEQFKDHQRIFIMMGFDHAREMKDELAALQV